MSDIPKTADTLRRGHPDEAKRLNFRLRNAAEAALKLLSRKSREGYALESSLAEWSVPEPTWWEFRDAFYEVRNRGRSLMDCPPDGSADFVRGYQEALSDMQRLFDTYEPPESRR